VALGCENSTGSSGYGSHMIRLRRLWYCGDDLPVKRRLPGEGGRVLLLLGWGSEDCDIG
jgi:hypothetical protein